MADVWRQLEGSRRVVEQWSCLEDSEDSDSLDSSQCAARALVSRTWLPKSATNRAPPTGENWWRAAQRPSAASPHASRAPDARRVPTVLLAAPSEVLTGSTLVGRAVLFSGQLFSGQLMVESVGEQRDTCRMLWQCPSFGAQVGAGGCYCRLAARQSPTTRRLGELFYTLLASLATESPADVAHRFSGTAVTGKRALAGDIGACPLQWKQGRQPGLQELAHSQRPPGQG